MNKYYKDININSAIEPMYNFINDNIIETTIRKCREALLTQYNNAFRPRYACASNNNNLHINQFMDLLLVTDVKNLYDKHNIKYSDLAFLKTKIDIANDMVKKKFDTILRQSNLADYMNSQNYKKALDSNFYLAYSNINFTDYIFERSMIVNINKIK